MKRYALQRLIYMIFLLWMVSVVTFVIIELPPGDYLSTYIARLEQNSGEQLSEDIVEALRRQYGLDLPIYSRYFKWFGQVLQGDFGFSFDWQQPVRNLIGERLALTFTIAILSAIFTYAVAIPIGIYSATNQYSIWRLFRFHGRIRRFGDTKFYVGADHALRGIQVLRTEFDRFVFA